MLNLTLKEIKLTVKNRSIRGYKRMSKDELISSINESKAIKNKTTKGIRKYKDIKSKALGDIRNLYRLEKNKSINDRLLRDIRTLYGSDEEDYYKPIRTGNVFSSNYIEYQINEDKDNGDKDFS